MSHYYALVIIPAEGDVTELIAETLAPYDKNRQVEQVNDPEYGPYWHNPRGSWYWYQLGGRWTGQLAGLAVGMPYDPEQDPANQEPNNWPSPAKWPTQWAPCSELDVVPAKIVLDALASGAFKDSWVPFSIFTHDSEHVTVKVDWSRDDWREAELTKGQIRDNLTRILTARAQAGLVDRVAVVDHHS